MVPGPAPAACSRYTQTQGGAYLAHQAPERAATIAGNSTTSVLGHDERYLGLTYSWNSPVDVFRLWVTKPWEATLHGRGGRGGTMVLLPISVVLLFLEISHKWNHITHVFF